MAKRKFALTEGKIAKFEKEGRGQGEGEFYKPWITIQDVPSVGRSTRGKGWKTNREHHTLSTLETNYYYVLEWDSKIVDIREQFPLNREDTFFIAETKGIKHPTDPETQVPIVMTTDFLITLKTLNGNKLLARTVKPSEELDRERVIEKFEIERSYWDSRGVDWGIVTEKDLPKAVYENVRWVHNYYWEFQEFSPQVVRNYCDQMKQLIKKSKEISVVEVGAQFDEIFQLDNGTGLALIKHLIARKELKIDIKQKLRTHLWVKDVFVLEGD